MTSCSRSSLVLAVLKNLCITGHSLISGRWVVGGLQRDAVIAGWPGILVVQTFGDHLLNRNVIVAAAVVFKFEKHDATLLSLRCCFRSFFLSFVLLPGSSFVPPSCVQEVLRIMECHQENENRAEKASH